MMSFESQMDRVFMRLPVLDVPGGMQVTAVDSRIPCIKMNKDGSGLTFSDGTNAADTNLYRAAASSLKTDDNFTIGAQSGHATEFCSFDAAGKVEASGSSSASFSGATHASQHTDGTDDIRDATASVKGLATAAQITKLDGLTLVHNNLSGLQGGTTGEYYHLTSAENALVSAHKDRHDPQDGTDALDTAAPEEIKGVQAAAIGSAHSFARADHIHQIRSEVTDEHLVIVDDASVGIGEYAVWSAIGIKGRTFTEVRTDINVENNADVTDDVNVRAALAAATATLDCNGQTITNVGNVDGVDVSALDAAVVKKALFNANTILAATTDDTPAAVTVAVDTLVGRKTGGNIDDLSGADLAGVLRIAGAPVWEKFTVLATDFTAAGTSCPITLFSLPAGGVIHAVKIKHSTAFSQKGLTAATLEIGIGVDHDKYHTAFDVHQAFGDTVQSVEANIGTENHGGAISIMVTLTCTGANCNQVTVGECDIWVMHSVAT